MSLTDRIIDAAMDRIRVSQEQIDKAKEIIDMLTFTKEDGKDVIIVDIGKNIQLIVFRNRKSIYLNTFRY